MIVQQVNWAALSVGEGGGGVDAEHVIQRGQDILRSVGLSAGTRAVRVGGPDDLPHLQSAAEHQSEASRWPVASSWRAAGIGCDLWFAAKLAPKDNCHIVGQAP